MHRRSTINLILATILTIGVLAVLLSVYIQNLENTAGQAVPQAEVQEYRQGVEKLVYVAEDVFILILLGTGAIWIYKKLSRGIG